MVQKIKIIPFNLASPVDVICTIFLQLNHYCNFITNSLYTRSLIYTIVGCSLWYLYSVNLIMRKKLLFIFIWRNLKDFAIFFAQIKFEKLNEERNYE